MKNNLAVPIAIVIAGLIMGSALYFGGKNETPADNNPANPSASNPANTSQPNEEPKEISSKDHVLGNPNAEISYFIYSDLQCPYCRKFHSTIQQITEDYVKNGKIKMVFRHFPLSKMHPNAEKFAEATECAAELGGKTKFWEYMGKLIELDTDDTSKTAGAIGLDKTKFENCLNSGKYAEKVKADYDSGTSAGVQGTPHSIIVKNGKNYPISGALPYLETNPALYEALEESQRKILCNDADKICGIKIAIDKILSE